MKKGHRRIQRFDGCVVFNKSYKFNGPSLEDDQVIFVRWVLSVLHAQPFFDELDDSLANLIIILELLLVRSRSLRHRLLQGDKCSVPPTWKDASAVAVVPRQTQRHISTTLQGDHAVPARRSKFKPVAWPLERLWWHILDQ